MYSYYFESYANKTKDAAEDAEQLAIQRQNEEHEMETGVIHGVYT